MAFQWIAHRCGPGRYLEQTIVSAREALRAGADLVEADVTYTRDGVPVISHDANVKRIFGRDANVAELTREQFMALRHGEDPAYPSHSLDDFCAAGVAPLLLHCKVTGALLADLTSRLLRMGYAKKATIGVLSAEDVETVKRVSPETEVLAFMPSMRDLDDFLISRADVIRLWEAWTLPEQMGIDACACIHRAGKRVWIMAGECTMAGCGYPSAAGLRRILRLGVDGVLVNDVAWARNVADGGESE